MRVNELKKELLNNKSGKFVNYIKKEFYYLNNDNASKIRNNIDTLNKIDEDIINYVIAKLESQKSDYESIAITLILWTLLITIVISLLEIASSSLGLSIEMLDMFFALIIAVGLMTILIFIQQRKNKVIVFFLSLLKEAKSTKR